MRFTANDKQRFQSVRKDLLRWHKKNARQFSWRKEYRDAYEVLVCEVMGQQTQASRIELFLPKFLKRFPTAASLSKAKTSDVIKAWQGLGYNRRALNLQKAAAAIAKNSFPKTEEELLALPGVGKYTARAIQIFAFNKRVATIDVNIERVISRLYRRMKDRDAMLPRDQVYPLAEAILPKNNSREWHEALMDFGATICTKRNPKCVKCPLSAFCQSHGRFENSVTTDENKERKYFGAPKRIWRGKVLKLLIQSHKTHETYLINAFQNSFPSHEFGQFIKTVLRELTAEGFCEKKNNSYSLSQK